MKRKVILFITIVLIVIGLAIGAYFFLEKLFYENGKNYILDSALSNQHFELSADEIDESGKVMDLGYIKLNNKEYQVTYQLNLESLDWLDINGDLTIGDKKFNVDSILSLYLLPDAILIEEYGNCLSMKFTIINKDLNEIVSDLGFYGYDDHYPDFVDWNKKVVTYYKVIDQSMEMEEYQINFAGSKVENPKLIEKIKVTNYGCGGK